VRITNYQIMKGGSNDLFYTVDDVASVRQAYAPPRAFVLALNDNRTSRTSGLDAGPIYAYTTKLLETRALGPRLRKGGVEPKECSRE
jgi:hypothetical protein